MMRSIFLLCFVTACAASNSTEMPAGSHDPAPAGSEPQAPASPSDEAPAESNPLALAADDLFTKATTDGTFSGSVVVVDGGKVVLEKAYGLADRRGNATNDAHGIYRLGSVTKQFTAAAILALAEDGKLSVDDPITKHLSELPKANFSMDGVDVTLRHLLSHTSGIGDARATQWFKDHAWKSVIDPKEYVAVGAKLPMKRKPGTAFEYNNWAYYLLGLVVERVSGKPYATFMKERFFAPLAMTDTAVLRSSLSKEQEARIPHGYAQLDGDALATLDDEAIFVDHDMTMSFGSGQILSTTSDLVKWDRALAAKKVLPKLEDELWKPVLDDYGYGWVIEKRNGVDVEWHNGALSPLGFTSLIVRVPAKDRFVAYLANLDLPIVQPIEDKVITLATK